MLKKCYSKNYDILYPTESEKKGAFGDYLKLIRKYYRIMAIDVAELAEVPAGRLSEYENGKRLPTETTMNKIIRALKRLGVPQKELSELRETHDLAVSVSSPCTLGKMRKKYA